MGRSPDLPDPLENQSAAGGGGADDLLSQLAGDEIDRLLAEADAESSAAPPVQPIPPEAPATAEEPAAPSAPPAAAPAAAAAVESEQAESVAETPAPKEGTEGGAAEPALETQLDDLFKALNEPAAAPPAPAPAETAEGKAAEGGPAEGGAAAPRKPAATLAAGDLDAQLERLAQELLPIPEQEAALTAVENQPAAAAATAKAEASPAGELAPDPSEERDAREALLAAGPEELADPAAAADDGDGDAEGPVPWYLRPLVWLNAPFASLSDRGRELVGKVALATLLFSITVLTFLALTRHRL